MIDGNFAFFLGSHGCNSIAKLISSLILLSERFVTICTDTRAALISMRQDAPLLCRVVLDGAGGAAFWFALEAPEQTKEIMIAHYIETYSKL